MRAYEIQTYNSGRWKIDAVFDDRSLAMFEAKRMDDGNRFSGVRVVEETFDESTQKTATRTIFRGGRAENKAYKQDDKQPKRAGVAARGGGRDRNGKRGKRAKKKSSGLTGPLLILSFIIIGGLAGLFALQKLFHLG